MVGLVGLIKWSIQAPLKKNPIGNIYDYYLYHKWFDSYFSKEKQSQPVNQSNNVDEYIKYLAEAVWNELKKEVMAKRSGKGSICPICTNRNRADLYPE